ncbi:unnamed protein product [Paramecium primaurelia]|uniref:Uncharacterized protein n=1 Tax=Paramecium primaurelia TaxID=5886 RepID=A0A8S1NT83_PARPR|nr:unnamed protein product [Paramecium primaurelia]
MKQQQPYFIRPPNLSSRHSTNKISFLNKEDTPSNSQGVRRKTPIIAQPLHSPTQFKDLHRINPNKRIPTLNSPLHDGSISKYKIINDLSVYKLPTTRRIKSDDQTSKIVPTKKQKSQHINNIKLRTDRRKNFTPLTKMKTEPNEIATHSITKQDESQDILFRLHKQSIPTEPRDKFESILGDKIVSGIKKIEKKTENFIELEEDSQFFLETKQNKKNKEIPILTQETKERILDLLCLSTQDLKKKFAEQNRIGNSKINARQPNKLVIPRNGKSKFPLDFFNALLPNSIFN